MWGGVYAAAEDRGDKLGFSWRHLLGGTPFLEGPVPTQHCLGSFALLGCPDGRRIRPVSSPLAADIASLLLISLASLLKYKLTSQNFLL